MADIALGQSINASISATDPKATISGLSSYYDEYNLTGIDDYRQLTIKVETPGSATGAYGVVDLINSVSGAIIDTEFLSTSSGAAGTVLLPRTIAPGVSYKARVSSIGFGDYKISVVDGGKATSIVTSTSNSNPLEYSPVGTIGTSGTYFPLASSFTSGVSDVAKSASGQLYTVSGNYYANIGVVNAGAKESEQLDTVSLSSLKNSQGNSLNLYPVNALEFFEDKLYAIESKSTGDSLYSINVTTKVGTLVGSLPSGFVSSGDLVYDPSKSRFLATAIDTSSSDSLWQIPISNPSGASKIGQIGFTNVQGINFVNDQLTGFTYSANGGANQISINASNGVGTLGQKISGALNITGASTITYPSGPPPTQVSLTEFKKDTPKYMAAIRDYDGNDLGGSSTWKSIGEVDIQGDGDLESILVNPKIERFASVGSASGNVDFTKHGLNGDTRVVGIYLDPTLTNSPEKRGGPFDSQRRFQNDLKIDNLKVLAASDYNNDGFQDLYFKLGDGTAVLRCLMHKDGNVQYANYQSKSDLAAFMNANNVNNSVWGSWL